MSPALCHPVCFSAVDHNYPNHTTPYTKSPQHHTTFVTPLYIQHASRSPTTHAHTYSHGTLITTHTNCNTNHTQITTHGSQQQHSCTHRYIHHPRTYKQTTHRGHAHNQYNLTVTRSHLRQTQRHNTKTNPNSTKPRTHAHSPFTLFLYPLL